MTFTRIGGDWNTLSWAISVGRVVIRARSVRPSLLFSMEQRHTRAPWRLFNGLATLPRLNKSAVYRALDLLPRVGLVNPIDLGQGRIQYSLSCRPLSWPFTSRVLLNTAKTYQQSENSFPTQSNPSRMRFLAMTGELLVARRTVTILSLPLWARMSPISGGSKQAMTSR